MMRELAALLLPLLVIGLATGQLIPPDRCDDQCPQVFDPVCGTDGVTYGNDCALKQAQCKNSSLSKWYDGSCGLTTCSPIPCEFFTTAPQNTTNYVCGSDGVTYESKCELENAKCQNPFLYIHAYGPCAVCDVRSCPAYYSPICGSDGETYSNICELNNTKCTYPSLFKIADGPCHCFGACSEIFAPVCGTDGQTYSNECELEVAQCRYLYGDPQKAYDGECRGRCDKNCTMEYEPVCGSNGTTYDNNCLFKVAQCKYPSLFKIADGPCHCLKACSEIFAPLCGTDGQTYSNECQLEVAQCGNLYGDLQKAYDGECRGRCDKYCTKEYEPVCGSNGTTYDNNCLFKVAQCKNPKLYEQHSGECMSRPSDCKRWCPYKPYPVCGSNQKNYPSFCEFEIAQCMYPHLELNSCFPCGYEAAGVTQPFSWSSQSGGSRSSMWTFSGLMTLFGCIILFFI